MKKREYKQVQNNQSILQKLQKDSNLVVAKHKVNELKESEQLELIEEICGLILSDPERKLNNINTLYHLTQSDNIYVVQCSLLSFCELFANICPMYKLNRTDIESKMKTTLNKEDRQLINYEHMLLNNYEKFLKLLNMIIDQQFIELISTSVKCFVILADKLLHFNNSQSIYNVIIKYSLKKDKELQNICQEQVKVILKNKDVELNHIKLVILNTYAKSLEKKKEKQLPDKMVEVLNSLELDQGFNEKFKEIQEQTLKLKQLKKEKYRIDKEDKQGKRKENEDNDQRYKKVKNTGQQLKEKENKKLIKEIKNDLKDQENSDVKSIVKTNAIILEKLFYIYFKILTRNKMSKFYKDCLNGLLKFVHKINVDLIWNIIENLKESCQKLRVQADQQENRLLCILTINNIIDGPAQCFQIDDIPILVNVYTFIKDHYQQSIQIIKEQQIILLSLIENSFIKKRQFSNITISSFIVLLSFLIVQQTDIKFKLAIIFLIHKIIQKYPKQLQLLDSEGETSFNLQIDDPQITDAFTFSIRNNLENVQKQYKKSEKIYQSIKNLIDQNKLGPAIFTIDVKEYYNQL